MKTRQERAPGGLFHFGAVCPRAYRAARLWLGGYIQLGALSEDSGGVKFEAVEVIETACRSVMIFCELAVGDLLVDADRAIRCARLRGGSRAV